MRRVKALGLAALQAALDRFGDGDRLRESWANPEHLIRYGCREQYDPETGLKLPEKIVVYGSFQPFVGAAESDSNSEITRMYYMGGNTYALTVVIPLDHALRHRQGQPDPRRHDSGQA